MLSFSLSLSVSHALCRLPVSLGPAALLHDANEFKLLPLVEFFSSAEHDLPLDGTTTAELVLTGCQLERLPASHRRAERQTL